MSVPPHDCTGTVHRVNRRGTDMLHMYCTIALGHSGAEQFGPSGHDS